MSICEIMAKLTPEIYATKPTWETHQQQGCGRKIFLIFIKCQNWLVWRPDPWSSVQLIYSYVTTCTSLRWDTTTWSKFVHLNHQKLLSPAAIQLVSLRNDPAAFRIACSNRLFRIAVQGHLRSYKEQHSFSSPTPSSYKRLVKLPLTGLQRHLFAALFRSGFRKFRKIDTTTARSICRTSHCKNIKSGRPTWLCD